MTIIRFFDTPIGLYTTAGEIVKAANMLGKSLNYDATSNSVHPGSLCNQTITKFLKPGVAKQLGLTNCSVMQIYRYSSVQSEFAIDWLLENQYITKRSLKKDLLDVYSHKAAEVILRDLCADIVTITPNLMEIDRPLAKLDILSIKSNWMPDRSNSLLAKMQLKHTKVIDLLSPEEQQAVRKYERLVRQTREQGKRKITERGRK